MGKANEVINAFFKKREEIESQRQNEISSNDVETIEIKGKTVEDVLVAYVEKVKELQEKQLLVYAKFDNKSTTQYLLVRKSKPKPAIVINPVVKNDDVVIEDLTTESMDCTYKDVKKRRGL